VGLPEAGEKAPSQAACLSRPKIVLWRSALSAGGRTPTTLASVRVVPPRSSPSGRRPTQSARPSLSSSATWSNHDLRSTFASNALAAGVTVFELAKIMGSSVRMIERHYGALLDGAGAGISGRLGALEAELEAEARAAAEAEGQS
jgi:hypothetical protein